MNKPPIIFAASVLALVGCSSEPSGIGVSPPASLAPAPPTATVAPTPTGDMPQEDCALPRVEVPAGESGVDAGARPAPSEPIEDPADRPEVVAPPEEFIDSCLPPDEYYPDEYDPDEFNPGDVNPADVNGEDFNGDDFTDDFDADDLAGANTLEPGSVQLTVSNQSFVDPTVHLVVRIDDELVVDEDFEVGSQHNWTAFDVDSLAPGEHTITAESDTGVVLEETFTLPDDEGRYLLLNFWSSDAGSGGQPFELVESEIPFMFA